MLAGQFIHFLPPCLPSDKVLCLLNIELQCIIIRHKFWWENWQIWFVSYSHEQINSLVSSSIHQWKVMCQQFLHQSLCCLVCHVYLMPTTTPGWRVDRANRRRYVWWRVDELYQDQGRDRCIMWSTWWSRWGMNLLEYTKWHHQNIMLHWWGR